MLYSRFFDEIFTQPVITTAESFEKYRGAIAAISRGEIISFEELPKLQASFFDNNAVASKMPTNEQKGVAVIPVTGLLTSSGSWYDHGTEEISELMNMAMNDERVTAIVLNFDTVGGVPSATFPIIEVLNNKTKPVIAAVKPSCFSAGYLIAVHCDEIIATHKMAQVGSIGVMAQSTFRDAEYLKTEFGVKRVDVYPPESSYKNLNTRELEKGNDKPMIEEYLTPWAQFFQETVKTKMKKIDLSVPGIIEGKTFFAKDAVGYGMINKVMPYNEILRYAFQLNTRNNLNNLSF